jgi:hypothetical protein
VFPLRITVVILKKEIAATRQIVFSIIGIGSNDNFSNGKIPKLRNHHNNGVGLSEFESESLAPKAKRMDQATLQAPAYTVKQHNLFKNIYELPSVLTRPWILL